jgi:ABC-type Zn uptake system ZnuABC Zn-binding protein ZnuA
MILLAACAPAANAPVAQGLNVIAAESFLADIAQNVAGERLVVSSLIPSGSDPHTFEPAPPDIAAIEDADLLIISGAGLEEGLQNYLDNAGGTTTVLEASSGLAFREPGAYEEEGEEHQHDNDPHFWFDPILVIQYVENIRDALIGLDPDGAQTYNDNAEAYIAELKDLDVYIRGEVEKVPTEKRKLVMGHSSFGYFADRYGFEIVGAVIPSVSTGASPTPQEMAALIDRIKETGASAIFIPATDNPDMAAQVAQDAGVALITGLYTHSVSEAGGPAPTYIDMMQLDTRLIVEALK